MFFLARLQTFSLDSDARDENGHGRMEDIWEAWKNATTVVSFFEINLVPDHDQSCKFNFYPSLHQPLKYRNIGSKEILNHVSHMIVTRRKSWVNIVAIQRLDNGNVSVRQ